jgi:hypothetical protein
MKNKFLSMLVCFLLFQNFTFASTDDWETVMKQKKGKTLNILLNSGRWLTADIEMVDEKKLLVENGIGRYEAFWKNEIREIYVKTGSIQKSVLIGAAATAGTVLLAGLILESRYSGEDKYMLTTLATMYSIPIGASIGLGHGLLSEHKKRIYKSEDQLQFQKEEKITLHPLPEAEEMLAGSKKLTESFPELIIGLEMRNMTYAIQFD